ncbi:MAG: TSUP family transporter [Tagaea sp.]|nr:TSUP family transporter [Tagaea sp.]
MSELELVPLLAAGLALLAGGVVKGVIGVGTPLVVLPVLVVFYDVRESVQLLALPLFLSNVFQAWAGHGTGEVVRRVAPVVAGLMAGIVLGVSLAGTLPDAALLVVAGVFVCLASIATALTPSFVIPRAWEAWLGPLTGAAGGVLGGLTTLFGPAIALYLTGLRLAPATFVKAVSVLYTAGSGTLFVAVLGLQAPSGATLLLSLACVPPLFLGMALGQRLRGLFPPATLRLFVLAVVFVGGINMILRGI